MTSPSIFRTTVLVSKIPCFLQKLAWSFSSGILYRRGHRGRSNFIQPFGDIVKQLTRHTVSILKISFRFSFTLSRSRTSFLILLWFCLLKSAFASIKSPFSKSAFSAVSVERNKSPSRNNWTASRGKPWSSQKLVYNFSNGAFCVQWNTTQHSNRSVRSFTRAFFPLVWK